MISLSNSSFTQSPSNEDLLRDVAGLYQVKAFSRWLGLSASLQASTSDEAQFLKLWSSVENSHADLLLRFPSAFSSERKATQDSPLRLAQNILQQDCGLPLSPLFFHSLIGLKQWEAAQAEDLQRQALSHSEQELSTLLKKIQREDQRMVGEVITFCQSNKKGFENPFLGDSAESFCVRK